MLSHRGTRGGAADALAFGALHEAEDVLVEHSDAELRPLRNHARRPGFRARRVIGWTARFALRRPILLPATSLRQRHPAGHVVLLAHSLRDLGLLEQLRDVRRQARTVSVWVPELWPTAMTSPTLPYEPYALIDHLFIGVGDVAEQCRSLAPNADVHVVPPATDVVRFAPDEPGGTRQIAVLGIGRRDPVQHEQLRRWSLRTDKLYVYDTLVQEAVDWRQHRESLAHWYRHSHVSVCNYAKHDMPDIVGEIRLPPFRFYEGMAAGTLLLGMAPDEARQKDLIGRSIVDPLIDDLTSTLNPVVDADPLRPDLTKTRNDHVATASAGHDWGHRWAEILGVLGESVPERLAGRLERLSSKARDFGVSQTATRRGGQAEG